MDRLRSRIIKDRAIQFLSGISNGHFLRRRASQHELEPGLVAFW
jgi:hypothetical protein